MEEVKLEERKPVQKVTSGKVSTKKKTLGMKLAETFFQEDIGSVKTYIFKDVLIPSVKNAIVDMISNGVDMLFNGQGRSSASRRTSKDNHVSYSTYFSKPQKNEPQRSRSAANYDYKDVVLETRGDAEAVLNQLLDQIQEYKAATIADLYESVGRNSSYTDLKYGWTDLGDASVVRVREGYWVKLPKAELLE